MNQRVFKRLDIRDLNLVTQMEVNFRSDFICKENAQEFLSSPQCWLYACIEDNCIIGFAYGYQLNRLNNCGNMLYLHEVGVLPSYHRQGIARRMLTEIKDLSKGIGISKIFLFTQKSNTPACALYESLNGIAAHDDDVAYFFKLE